MTRRPAIGYLLALLAVVGLMLAPLVHATMAMGTAGHTRADHAMPDHSMSTAAADAMAGMDMAGAEMAGAEMAGLMADMPCCPHQAPVPDCGTDCPFMALCSAMPFSVPLAGLTAPLAEAAIVRPGDQSDLASLTRAPPRRPPKHPGSSAV